MYIINWYIHVVHEICCYKYQIPINAGTFISSDDVISHYKTQISHQISVKHLIIPSYLRTGHWHFQFLCIQKLWTMTWYLITRHKYLTKSHLNISSLSHYTKISQGDIFIKLKVNVNVFVTSKWYVKINPLLWIKHRPKALIPCSYDDSVYI